MTVKINPKCCWVPLSAPSIDHPLHISYSISTNQHGPNPQYPHVSQPHILVEEMSISIRKRK